MEFVARNLDFRFADDYDIADIVSFVNSAHQVEVTPGSDFHFRKESSLRVTLPEVEGNFESHSVRWILLETVVDEEIVGGARINVDNSSKQATVDVVGAVGETTSARDCVMKLLLQKVDVICYNMGLEKIIVPIPEWRTDIEKVLVDSGYAELSGYIWPVEKQEQLLKATMILEFHKALRMKPSTTIASKTVVGTGVGAGSVTAISPATTIDSSSAPTASSLSTVPPVIQGVSVDVSGSSVNITMEDQDLGNFHVLGANTTVGGDPPSASVGGGGSTITESALPDENMQQLMNSLFSALHVEYPRDGDAGAGSGNDSADGK